MPTRKKRLAGLLIIILTAIPFLFLYQPVSTIHAAEIREASPIEVEDRDLIHNLLKDKYYSYAREEATEYLEKYPGGIFRAEVIFVLAEVAVVEKAFTRALTYYNTLLKGHPNSELFEDSLYLSGILYLQQDKNEKGRARLRQLIQKYPQTRFLYRTYFRLGELAFQEQNWATAATYLKATTESGDLKPDQQLEAKNYLAWTYYFQGDKEPARSLFLQLLESNLSDIHKAKIAYQFAIDAQKRADYREAISWHERLMKQWPHPDFNDKSRFWIAESLFLLNQLPKHQISKAEKQKAITFFSQNLLLETPVEPENSHYHRGWFLLDLGKIRQAEKDFSWLQHKNKKYRKNVELTIIRARYYESSQNWDRANQIYSRSLKLQDSKEGKNWLLSGIVRNNYRQKKCQRLTDNFEKITQPLILPSSDEIYFYAGTCYYDQGDLEQAGFALGQIDITTRFAPLSFEYYLDALRKTGRQSSGIEYLTEVRDLDHFKDKERILLYRTEFLLELKQWLKALTTMKEVVSLSPAKKKDPWFLLNVARTLDQIRDAMNNKQWREQRPDLKPKEYYSRQAIIYYREAYKYMPIEKEAVRLSILDILIKHHESYKAWKTLILQYGTAIKLSKDEHQKDLYTFRLANIMIKTGEKTERIIPLLVDLHGSSNREVNFKASSLLAELHIGQQNFDEAIETLIDLAQQPIDKTPWYTKVHFRLGELYQSQEKWLAAIRHYSKVVNAKQAGGRKKEARSRLSKIKKFVSQSQAAKKTQKEK